MRTSVKYNPLFRSGLERMEPSKVLIINYINPLCVEQKKDRCGMNWLHLQSSFLNNTMLKSVDKIDSKCQAVHGMSRSATRSRFRSEIQQRANISIANSINLHTAGMARVYYKYDVSNKCV